MRVLVTGASGFLGSAVVERAVDVGHEVVALVRSTADVEGRAWSPGDVEVVRGDLRTRLDPSLFDGVDAVIHAAAATSGDLPFQLAGSVLATERLLDALDLAKLRRFVHVSSFSVYDFSATRAGGSISPATPVEQQPDRRDPYTVAKLAQERLVRARCAASGVPLVVIRPGVIFGPGKDWGWGRALRIGRWDVVVSPRARFRLTYVDNCAEALVAALDASAAVGRTIDVVDDDLPTHAGYRRLARRAGAPVGRWWVPVPWIVLAATGAVIDALDARFGGHRAKLPEIASRRRQAARWKPFEYSNADAKHLLGWAPRRTIAQAVAAVVAGGSR